jgi:hypothetical protein
MQQAVHLVSLHARRCGIRQRPCACLVRQVKHHLLRIEARDLQFHPRWVTMHVRSLAALQLDVATTGSGEKACLQFCTDECCKQTRGTSKRERFGRGITSWLLMPLPRVVAATTAPFAGGASVSNACIVEMAAASACMWPLTSRIASTIDKDSGPRQQQRLP